MKRMKIFVSIMLSVIFGLTVSSCNKDTATSYTYNVRMTDAPGPYSAVFIDLIGIEITGNDGKAVSMNVNEGIYNLLDFSNGVDTLISTGTLENANINQIRLILGSNNTLVINEVSYPLSTPSADQTGLKLKVHQTLQAGVLNSILLDFDANKSIIIEGNGSYKLKPVIRTIETAISGAIKGKITPVGISASITANTSDNSYSSNVSATGDFLLIGIPAGNYSVTIIPALPLKPVTQNNITVTTGITTNTGTITLE